MLEPLLEWVNANLLPRTEGLLNILTTDVSLVQKECNSDCYLAADALDAEVLELHRHVLVVDVEGADATLAAVLPHAGWADQVVRVGAGRLSIVGHTTAMGHQISGRIQMTNETVYL